MKRSPALAPLSRDHHVALVVATVLLRADPESADAAAARFVRFIAGHELVHFSLEESLLLPALGDDERGRALRERALSDHEFLREASRSLENSPDGPSVGFVHSLGARLRDHVRMEERELFPLLEDTLEPAELDQIGEAVARRAGDSTS